MLSGCQAQHWQWQPSSLFCIYASGNSYRLTYTYLIKGAEMIRYPNYSFNKDFNPAATTACCPCILYYFVNEDELYLMLPQHSYTNSIQ